MSSAAASGRCWKASASRCDTTELQTTVCDGILLVPQIRMTCCLRIGYLLDSALSTCCLRSLTLQAHVALHLPASVHKLLAKDAITRDNSTRLQHPAYYIPTFGTSLQATQNLVAAAAHEPTHIKDSPHVQAML